jgi:hypothetical protein
VTVVISCDFSDMPSVTVDPTLSFFSDDDNVFLQPVWQPLAIMSGLWSEVAATRA